MGSTNIGKASFTNTTKNRDLEGSSLPENGFRPSLNFRKFQFDPLPPSPNTLLTKIHDEGKNEHRPKKDLRKANFCAVRGVKA